MAQALSTLTAGTRVYLEETVDDELSYVPYIYLGLSESGNCVLLREYCASNRRMHSSAVASYDGCEMDEWLEGDGTGFLARFDEATLATFVSSQIKCYDITADEIVTIARRCYLLSYTELGYATTPDEGSSYLSALYTANDTTTANTARIAYNESLSAVSWWMRSAASETSFRCVYSSGSASSFSAASTSYYPRPALSVSPDTLVSDGTEDTIYLLPDSDKLYREVDAIVYMGSSSARPIKAKLIVSTNNCTSESFAVSNNAKDSSPTWVEIENGGTVELPNTEKETDDWELGVKIYATSGGRAEIGEPVLIVTTKEDDE